MSLKYYLSDNYLKPGSSDLVAKNYHLEYLSQEDVVEIMTRSGSILKQTEIMAVIGEFFQVLQAQLKEGKGIRSEYLVLTPTIKGSFHDQEDKFEQKRHTTDISVTLGKPLKAAAGGIKVQKVKAPVFPLPQITSFTDYKTGVENSKLLPDSLVEIKGAHLKIMDLNDLQQGVFFVNVGNGKSTRAEQYRINHPKQLMFYVPKLKNGKYLLEVRGLRTRRNPKVQFEHKLVCG